MKNIVTSIVLELTPLLQAIKIVTCLLIKEIKDKAMVFNTYDTERFNNSFPNFTCNPIRTLDHKNVHDWLIKIGKTKGITIKFSSNNE